MVRRDPWDRLPREPDRGWMAFRAYRDMGLGRTILKTAEETGIPRNTIGGYVARYAWTMRVAAFDAEQDRLDQEFLRGERRKALMRHIRQAQALQNVWMQRLQSINPGDLTPSEMLRYAEVATKMEREALQLNDQLDVNVRGVVLTDASMLSAQEVKARLSMLQAEVAERLADANRVITIGPEAEAG